MSLPAPLLLMGGPLLPALLTAALRRWPRLAAGVGVVSAMVLWRLTASVSLAAGSAPSLFAGDTLLLLGRSLTLTEGVRLAFTLLYGGLALLLLLSIWLPQGSDFTPASFAVLAILSAAVMARPFSFAALLLLAAAAVSTAVLQADRPDSADAALRYLVFVALATPLFLAASWMLDSGQLSLQGTVWRLLLGGFALLLAGFPFYIWVRPLVVASSSLTPAFQFGLAQFGQFIFVLALLQENSWVWGVPAFLELLRWSGLLTLALGGVLALISRDAGHVLGSLLLVDLGGTLLLLTLGATGPAVALAALLARFGALVGAGVGMTALHRRRAEADHTLAWWLGLAAFVYAALSLLGFPLTPGFAPRWGLVTLLAQPDSGWVWAAGVVIAALVAGAAGLIKCARALLEMPAGPLQLSRSWRDGMDKPITIILVVFLLGALAFVFFPQTILRQAGELAPLFAPLLP